MSDKSPRQGMTKKTGKSIKEKRADKRAKETAPRRPDPHGQEAVTASAPGWASSARRPRRTSTGSPSTPSTSPGSSTRSAARITLEHGYGERFGVSDARLAASSRASPRARSSSPSADVVLLPKPQHEDVADAGAGQVLWGWPHCVQDAEITQLAIDRRLTLIAFEAMNHWTRDGGFGLHVFHKNNELAGYCSVLHALAAGRSHRRLRSPAQRGGDRVRRHRARRGHRAERARRPRRRRADQPRRRGRRLADPLGADPAVRPRRRRPATRAT